MIHPHTRIQFINEDMGYGVFATQFIPRGTITYVKDSLELEVFPEAYQAYSPEMQEVIEKYSYIDERGVRIISWDFAKYVNHCCNCNTMSTGYGFEMAIRDIHPGEEITDEYGIFNIPEEMGLFCKHENCRLKVQPDDFDRYYPKWDEQLKAALAFFSGVEQPLFPLLDLSTQAEVRAFLDDPGKYKSVYALKFQPQPMLNGVGKAR
ncbi:MAG: SET domain-containing protein [Phaeodactylibacter sp.]|nr:SET domain-containing protein [Phaeodactylibacter sp.]MCB9272518.1 SET domain-containing protein [Lewinellaceae bacterium]